MLTSIIHSFQLTIHNVVDGCSCRSSEPALSIVPTVIVRQTCAQIARTLKRWFNILNLILLVFSRQVLPLSLYRTLWRSTAWWGGQGREGARELIEVEHRSSAPVGPSQQQSYYGSLSFFFNRALVCFLIPHSFCEQLQHARHCYRYWRNSHEQRPSFCGAYILVGLSLLLKYFILLKVLAGPDFFLPDRNKRNDRNVKHCLFQIHIEKRVMLSGIWSSSSWGIYFVFCKRG